MIYPIGIQDFEKIRLQGCVYIDKTAFGEKGRMTLGRSAELTICARKGSYAEGYARVTGIQFKPIE